MPERPPNALYAYTGAFVDELARAGLHHVCICPGSRSTPLAIALARQPGLKIWMHLDERSAAFFALGLAKAANEPVALLCTSGTAAANFLPAVVEASMAQVPLLVLTADRPPELREVGAAQTIDQRRIYGSHARWFVDMATPAASETLLRSVRTIACRALARTLAAPAGPVHLNFPFREPLLPVPAPEEIPDTRSDVALFGRPDGRPYVTVPEITGSGSIFNAALRLEIAGAILQAQEGLIVCGPLAPGERRAFAGAINLLSERTGYPILADPLSGLRCGDHDTARIVDAYDALLRVEAVAGRLAPRLLIRFGALPTSKPLLQYLQRHGDACRQIVVSHGDWQDPTLLAGTMIDAEPAAAALAIAECAAGRRDPPAASTWLAGWQEANRQARAALDHEIEETDELFEGRVFSELQRLLPNGATLWAGSSMPVRDLDTFFPADRLDIHFLANRGANGIDGVVSSALGAAAAGRGPAVLVIGDVSFYHDMNGLLAAARYGLNLTVVLINNDGGGIFSFLPQASETSLMMPAGGGQTMFEQLFGTPHGLDFAHAAALYGARHTRIADWDGFRLAVQSGIERGGLHIVEVPTDRARNVILHRRCWSAVARALPEA